MFIIHLFPVKINTGSDFLCVCTKQQNHPHSTYTHRSLPQPHNDTHAVPFPFFYGTPFLHSLSHFLWIKNENKGLIQHHNKNASVNQCTCTM